ncbi:hypothetical protein HPB50_014806 [Hyalomma asiaticum]|uniref:Uncharacterized protein n=1 Tax=Hyalomma asiaticum TaxID=266040 RepID=A0ACB7SFC7_HYAAI|nr:hypothetical protein HPB50_014806 [Hyalomma asiaticum]
MRAASWLWRVALCSAALRPQFSPADAQPDTTPGVPPTSAHVARSGGLLSAWAEAAVVAADLLGRIRAGVTGGDDHTSADAFLYELASRTRTAEALDLVYRRHPRLRTFLVCLLLAGVSLLAVAGPITIVACITSGSVPFVRRATAPQHCLACCVLLGMLAMLAFGDLVIMLVCHVAVTDATTRVPAAFAKTAAELRRYVNRTVVELLVELNEDDYGVASSVRTFLYGVISEDAFGRIVSMNCLAALANRSFASKLRLCKNVSVQMLMPGAQLPKEADIIEENLQLQLNRTLESVGELESRFYGFEQRTRLWKSSALVDHVGVPMAMVLFCVVIAVLGCGIGMGIRGCVNLSGKPPEAYRYTGVVFLADAVLVMLFHVLATALLTTTVTTGVLADCYVCLPYRRMGFVYLDRLAQMMWPNSERGLLFALLTPYAVLTKCAGEGASIVELRVVHERKNPYVTRTTQRATTPWWLLQSATQRVERNPTAGNCKALYNALVTSMSTFCDKFLKNHLGMTLSLTVGLILSAAILPLTLIVSQYFMVPLNHAAAGIGGITERRKSKRRESSRKESSKNAAYISNASATSKTISTRASKADVPLPTGDGNLARKDSLIVLRKRMQEKEVNEPTSINLNTLLGVAATLLLTVLLIGYIVGVPREHGISPCTVLAYMELERLRKTFLLICDEKPRADLIESTADDEDFSAASTDIPTETSRPTRPPKTKLVLQRSDTAAPFNSTDQEYDTT